MNSWLRGVVFLVAGGIFAFPVMAQRSSKEAANALKEYERKLEDQRQRLELISGQEGALLNELDAVSRTVNRLNKEVHLLSEKQEVLKKRLEETTGDIVLLGREVDAKKEGVRHRLRELYKWGQPNVLRLVLSAQTPGDFRKQRFLLQRWIDVDRELIGSFQQKALTLTNLQTSLSQDRRDRDRLLRGLASRRNTLKRTKTDRAQLLALVRGQKKYYEQSIRDLEAASKNLEKLMTTLQRKEREGGSRFGQMKGRLILPVQGKLLKAFGPHRHQKFHTKLYHKGVDLSGEFGEPIRVVFDGRVVYSGWFTGYGNILIVDHGGGYFTLYAHASELLKEVGEAVVAGEVIARVGDTGSLQGPYLYFELRHKGISKDPWPWFVTGSRKG